MTEDTRDMLLEITQDTSFPRGHRWHAQELLENRDPCGGTVSLEDQANALLASYYAVYGSSN